MGKEELYWPELLHTQHLLGMFSSHAIPQCGQTLNARIALKGKFFLGSGESLWLGKVPSSVETLGN